MQSLALVMSGGVWLSARAWKGVRTCVGTGLVAAVPFVLALSALVLIMATFGIPIDIGTAAIGAMAFSVAVDMPIFVLLALQSGNEARVSRELNMVVADTLVNAAPFLALCFSVFPPVFRFGLLIATVIIVCGLATLFVMLPLARRMMEGKE